jgi:hypothetical protein
MLKKLSFLVVLSFFVLRMRQSVFGFVQRIDDNDSEFKKCIEMCREEEREYVLTCINKFNKK